MHAVRPLLAALLLAGYGAVAGCSGATTTPPADHAELPGQAGHTHGTAPSGRPSADDLPSSEVDQVQPGGPGEASTTLAPDEGVAGTEWNHDDVSYLQMMIPHHGQALEMAELATTRAADRQVRAVADRIDAAQGPEIWLMAGWLSERGIDVPSPEEDPHDYDHGDHGHNPMVGLLSDDELAALADADGASFDRLFLTGMVRHHEGAIAMAEDVLAGGSDQRVAEIAADVVAGQAAEVARMKRILANLD